MAFDEMDFDEPMEVGLEEEAPVVKDDAESKPEVAAVTAVKVEAKAEPQDPVLMWVFHAFSPASFYFP